MHGGITVALLLMNSQSQVSDQGHSCLIFIAQITFLFAELDDGSKKLLDVKSRTVGFPPVYSPFSPIYLVVSDLPITYESYNARRRKREVDRQSMNAAIALHRRKRQIVSYEISACDSVFTSSTLAT